AERFCHDRRRRRGLQAARPLLGPSVSSGVFDDAIRGRHARHANTEQPARIDRVPFPILTGREKLISSSRRMAWQSSAPGGAEARLNAERSEERRVGKEWRYRWGREQRKEKEDKEGAGYGNSKIYV